MASHGSSHGLTRYRDGCRCNVCRAAKAEASRRTRAKDPNARAKLSTVTPIGSTAAPSPAATPAGPGANELAWLEQCDLSSAAEKNPSIVAQGRSLASLLDDTSMRAIWPTTSRQLAALRKELAGPRRKSKSRISFISAMTQSGTATTKAANT
jgi:hypothetical protein